jgi:ribosome-binding factor A
MGKVNSRLKRVFGEIIIREADLPIDSLVTISEVDTARNLRSAIVWISVLPLDQASKTVKKLKSQMYHLQGLVNKELNMRPLPRITLRIDHGAEHSDKIERKLADLN